MSLYDHENPQHLDYLARAKASSRRTTAMLDAAQRDGGAGLDLTGMVEAKAAGRIDDANRRLPWAQRVRAA